ncbi:hypothetical protein [Synechococcus sp. WH 8020]|uniref:hypothetical protein n=1 Tax=Synechococcus sp. (strain WH8020) TaxID=32052 RepID=UPI0012EDB477|nr:hypothetical protein [Synechococcus sp. WH 8020]
MSSSNKALFARLCELGLRSTINEGPLFLGEFNECQAQFVNSGISATNNREVLIVGISTSVDGWEFSENTGLIDPSSRKPIWFEHGIQTPEESDPKNINNIANQILEKHLEQILLLIEDGNLENHSLSQITSEYGEKAVASYIDLEEVDRNWLLNDFNFHLRFSCADMLLGIEGSLDSPAAVSLRELKWGADDFAECSYFDEICSDLEMDSELIE